MQPSLSTLNRNTPTLAVLEPRGLSARSVDYYRETQNTDVEARVNRTAYDAAGRAVAQWDPRLLMEMPEVPNTCTRYGLSGSTLSVLSVDAGLRVNLRGQASQLVYEHDSRGSQRWLDYDDQLRLSALYEQPAHNEKICTERLGYGTSDAACAKRNQCGHLVRHDDPAGTHLFSDYGLRGGTLERTRRFLRDLIPIDWPEVVADRDACLEPGQGAVTRWAYSSNEEVIQQTDAESNRQFFRHTVAGQLLEVHLQLQSQATPILLIGAIEYNAHDQREREVAGNGVITTLQHSAADARLTSLRAHRGTDLLQDLAYEYDAKGNVVRIQDDALPTRYFANQRIDPVNLYTYDSLDQLISATGWEAGAPSRGPHFFAFDDPSPRSAYRQSYRYDRGGNLLELSHEGPQSHGHCLAVAFSSNRCLPVVEGVEPGDEDFRNGFDGNGSLLKVQPGQLLGWNLRNELREVQTVVRDNGKNDHEIYAYGADGMRVRKVRSVHAGARMIKAEVRYLPGLEIRTHSGTGEVLHVISVQAGRSNVKVLHWQSPAPSANDAYRFSFNDQLGSCLMEVDVDGGVISQERYHPFGTTAWFAGRSEAESDLKWMRYSGQERDATGFYYYGFRFYLPSWQRWLNPDPAGNVDGLNLYRMVENRPMVFKDHSGLAPVVGEGVKLDATVAPTQPEHKEQAEVTFVSYRVEGLKERLATVDEQSQGRAERVSTKFTHKVVLKTIVMTEPKSKDPDKTKVSKFFNRVSDHEWEFMQNYKFADAGEIFANDVFRKQYEVASRRNDKFGVLPSTIRRSKVKNQTTLDQTQGLGSGSPELMEAFFQGPNGKTTKKVMEDFGLIATGVTIEPNGKDLDFVVAVKPIDDHEVMLSTQKRSPSRTVAGHL